MAVSLLSHVVISDLCLGKPALRSLSISATVADALTALKSSEDSFISVWDCTDHTHSSLSVNVVGHDQLSSYHCTCTCVGKVCMVDVICYLCKNENLLSPFVALKAPISEILPKIPGLVMHLEPSSRYYICSYTMFTILDLLSILCSWCLSKKESFLFFFLVWLFFSMQGLIWVFPKFQF